MAKRSILRLTAEERAQLLELTRQEPADERSRSRARILLMAHDGDSDGQIARAVHLSVTTVRRVRQQFLQDGLDGVLGAQPPRPPVPSPARTELPSAASVDTARPPSSAGPLCATQWTGTVAPDAEHVWFSAKWPAAWHVVWTIVPTTPHPGAPALTWQVGAERSSAEYVTYWITVKNLTSVPISFEGRYAILTAG
jgi:hypothetical protein